MNSIEWCNQFYERVWHTNDPTQFDAAINDLVSSDCVVIGLATGENIAREGFRQFRRAFLGAFDSVRIRADACITEGDRLAVRATFTARKGDKSASILGSAMLRLRDGQIVEAYNHWDWLSLFEQFEQIPANSMMNSLERLQGGAR